MNEQMAIVSLVRMCVVFRRDGPWEDLLARLDSTIKKKAPSTQSREFFDWLPGWLIEGQRLESLLIWLEKKIANGEFTSMNDQEQALAKYLARTVKSGVGAFFREKREKGGRVPIKHFSEGQDARIVQVADRISPEDLGRISKTRQFLLQLEPDLYLPFWLRYYVALGSLDPASLEWIGRQCGASADNVSERIEAEVEGHEKAEFPISAAFIGQLLGIPPSVDGRYLAVDQRISRVRTQLRKRFRLDDESECE